MVPCFMTVNIEDYAHGLRHWWNHIFSDQYTKYIR